MCVYKLPCLRHQNSIVKTLNVENLKFDGNLAKDDAVENITRLKFYLYLLFDFTQQLHHLHVIYYTPWIASIDHC